MAQRRDYYEILSVSRDCDEATLKSAYRKLALTHHPDRNPNNPDASEKFKEASEAYAVLSDVEKRARYDQFGHAGVGSGPGGHGGFSGFDPSAFGDFSDLFNGIFGFATGGGFGGAGAGPVGGSDLVYRMELAFEDAAHGVEAPIAISRLESCGDCGGAGAAPGTKARACPACRGTGRQRLSQGFLTVTRPCGSCRGEGRVIDKPCPGCRGEGRRRGKKELTIKIPAGVETGSRLRLTGEGDAGPNGGPAGDLYVVLTVAEHELFDRDGDDLILRLDLPFPTLVLGGDVEVPTLEGNETVSIAAGTASGSDVRLRGRGFGRLGRNGRGDLVLKVGVRVPDKPSREEKELLRRYAELVGAPVSGKGVFRKARKIFS